MKHPRSASSFPWLAIARWATFLWLTASLFIMVFSLPAKYQSLQEFSPASNTQSAFAGWTSEQVQAGIAGFGLPSSVIAGALFSASLICLLCFWGVAYLIFWQKSGTWTGLLASFLLLSTGPGFSGLLLSQSQIPEWARSFYSISAVVTWPTFFVMFYLFPNGSVFPRFARYLVSLPYLLFLVARIFPENWLVNSILPVVLIIFALGGLVSQIFRYRRVSTPDERLQTKWILFALVITFSVSLLGPFLLALNRAWVVGTPARFWYDFINNGLVSVLAPALLPLALGISILRHHLWNIDVIIRRTLIFGILTAILALVYFGSVILLQQIFRVLTGQTSPAVVVISTLVIAALFTPLRRRIQTTIDRRFFRSQYNAEHALARFSQNLREWVDLPSIESDLVGVVTETIQPTQVSLWIREVKTK